MIEQINKLNKYTFPHSKDPDELPPIPDDLPKEPSKPISYIKFVQSKNIIDILHQIEIMAIKGKQRELNLFFRSALEAILLHVDETGKHDIKYQDSIE